MTKRILVALAACMFAVASYATDELKFGHINLEALVMAMPEYQEAQKSVEDLQLMYVNELQKLEKEFQEKYTAFQQEQEKLDPAIRASRQAELEKMYENMNTFQTTAQENLQKKQIESMAPVTEKAEKAIKQVGAEMKLIYIFDEQGSGLHYVSSQSVDVMPAVKKKLGLQ